MMPLDNTRPLAENRGVITWGASKIRQIRKFQPLPVPNLFRMQAVSQTMEAAASAFWQKRAISRYAPSPARLRRIHRKNGYSGSRWMCMAIY